MTKHHPPILTKPAAGARASEPLTAKVATSDPDALVDEILSLLSQDRYRTARNLASKAISRFPDNARVRGVWGIFDNRDKAKASAVGPQPAADEEFEWLKNPPEWARGKWVALVGAEAVGTASTLDELMEQLGPQELSKSPLTVHIDES